MRTSRLIPVGLAAFLISMLAGAAVATSTTGPFHWITFSNGGVSICVEREAVVDAFSSTGGGTVGQVWTQTRVKTYHADCSTPLNRQSGYHGAKSSIIRADGVVCLAGGYAYSPSSQPGWQDTSQSDAPGPACHGNFRNRASVKEWDVDTASYKESNNFFSPFEFR